jgi:hypothetical protein
VNLFKLYSIFDLLLLILRQISFLKYFSSFFFCIISVLKFPLKNEADIELSERCLLCPESALQVVCASLISRLCFFKLAFFLAQKRIIRNRMDGIETDFKHLFLVVFAESILLDYNWSGRNGKKRMDKLRVVWSVMYRKNQFEKFICVFEIISASFSNSFLSSTQSKSCQNGKGIWSQNERNGENCE